MDEGRSGSVVFGRAGGGRLTTLPSTSCPLGRGHHLVIPRPVDTLFVVGFNCARHAIKSWMRHWHAEFVCLWRVAAVRQGRVQGTLFRQRSRPLSSTVEAHGPGAIRSLKRRRVSLRSQQLLFVTNSVRRYHTVQQHNDIHCVQIDHSNPLHTCKH